MTFLDTAARYIAERYMRFDEGQISIDKVRLTFNFLPITAREFLINNEFGRETYSAVIFISARKLGYEFIKHHGIPLMKNWTPIVKLGMEWMNLFGGGTYRTLKADNKEGFLIIAGRSSFGLEMKAERPSVDPVDFVVGGVVAGTIQYYTKTPVYAVETACIAQKGVQECVWAIGNRENIMEYVRKFSPDKVEWGNRTLDQTEAVEKEVEASEDKVWFD